MTKQIPLTGKHGEGKFAIVDDADYETLLQYKWYVTANGYASRAIGSPRKGGTIIAMHRAIMNPPHDMVIDHINHDTLDNTRANLRITTHRQNIMNAAPSKNSTSPYKGVCWNKNKHRWMAHITVHGKSLVIGQYVTQREAALAYNDAAVIHFGEYAHLNIVPLIDPSDEPVAERQPPKKSQFRGVSKGLRDKKWFVHIRIDGKITHIGCFVDELEAAKAYDELARKHHGNKAKLNFP